MSVELDLGARLIKWRRLWGLSQRELARRAGITNGALSQIEQGNTSPSIQTLQKIADAFGLSLEGFMFGGQLEPLALIKAADAKAAPFCGGRLYQYPDQDVRLLKLLMPAGCYIAEKDFVGLFDVTASFQLYVAAGFVELRSGGVCCELKAGDLASVCVAAGVSVTSLGESLPSELLFILPLAK